MHVRYRLVEVGLYSHGKLRRAAKLHDIENTSITNLDVSKVHMNQGKWA